MNVRFFDPARSYREIKPEIDAEMQRVLEDGDLILRADVDLFEEKLARYVGTKYAVAVASGTDALILSLKAAGLQPGERVLCPSYTFRATAEAIHHAGGVPVLYDIFSRIDLTQGIRFMIPAHIAGEVRTDEVFFNQAEQVGLTIIEDAAQAIGAAPVRGLMACYSFYPAKILGCYGDGGAIATNDENMYKQLKLLRNHYKGDWSEYAYNSRLDNLQAAVLNVKIKYLPQYIARRKEIAALYDHYLKGVEKPEEREVYQDYIVVHENRDGLHDFLAGAGIETMKNEYPFPAELEKGPGAVAFEAHSLRLPCNPELSNEEVMYVIDRVNAYGRP